jgi:hypothetical protein
MEKLQCGALSGLFAQTLAYPLEVTRRRMQTIGIVPTSGSESAAINFLGVSPLKPSVDELPQQQHGVEAVTRQSNVQTLRKQQLNVATSSEEVAKKAATTSVTNHTQQRHYKPPSMILTMRHLFEEQGLRGFYKGVSMNWVKGPIAFSISFTAFDTIQGWIETESEREKRSQLSKTIQRRLTNNED